MNMTAKCAECGEEFVYIDERNIPPTCGKRSCVANYSYRLKHMDPMTGKMPEPKDVKKI